MSEIQTNLRKSEVQPNNKQQGLQFLLRNRLIEQFENAKLNGAGHLSPRAGYYFIIDVDYKKVEDRGKFPIASVLWKRMENDAFVKDVKFKIALSSLGLNSPFDYLNTVNRILFIKEVTIIKSSDPKATTCLKCEHIFTTEKPEFTTLQDLVFSAFMCKAHTLKEAYDNFETNLGIDLSSAIQDEVVNEEAYDEPMN